jgi:tRNA modification GTPase
VLKDHHRTIIAQATPPGRSGVAIIRISGPNAFSLLQKLTRSQKKIIPRKIQLKKIFDEKKNIIDEALVWCFKRPKTYTGENMVEISTHGNPLIINNLIKTALAYGASLAERGEFTKRAYLAGKLDLAQAEAIACLINSNSQNAAKNALTHLEGALSKNIKSMRTELIELLAKIELTLDYPDELSSLSNKTLIASLKKLLKQQVELLKTEQQGKLLKEGLKVVITGQPNVGKSSLLNIILGEQKSIVTEIPGTTRDSIEDLVNISGLPLKIIDTAGLRKAANKIEKIGIKNTKAHIATADLVIFLLDLNGKISPFELEQINNLKDKKIPHIITGNKADLFTKKKLPALVDVSISAKTGLGIDKLKKRLLKKAGFVERLDSSSPIIMENRHKEKLLEAKTSLENTITSLKKGIVHDLITIDLKQTITSLGEITGEEVSEEIITHIFDNFCVGK